MLIKTLLRDEAMNVLCALNEKDAEDPYIVAEFAAIKDSALVMQQGGFRDLFTMDEDRNFHRVVLAYVNQMFQQISGVSKARVQIVVCTLTPTPPNQPNSSSVETHANCTFASRSTSLLTMLQTFMRPASASRLSFRVS